MNIESFGSKSNTNGSYGRPISSFLRNLHSDFHSSCPHQLGISLPFSLHSHQHLLSCVFLDFSHSHWVRWNLKVGNMFELTGTGKDFLNRNLVAQTWRPTTTNGTTCNQRASVELRAPQFRGRDSLQNGKNFYQYIWYQLECIIFKEMKETKHQGNKSHD